MKLPLVGLTLLLLASLLLSPLPSLAQSALDEVDECDLLAGHPADPERFADGVADTSIVPRLAVKACEAAVKQSPDNLRFAYQYGRALVAANRRDAADVQFRRAAAGDYAPAFAALAELGLDSVNGQKLSDLVKSREAIAIIQDTLRSLMELHVKAVQGGFTISQQRVDALTFEPDLFTHAILGKIVSGEFDAARSDSEKNPDVRAYLYTFTTNLISQCGPIFDAKSVARLLAYRFGGAISAEQEESPPVSFQPLVGEIDAQRFVRRHGCEGALPQLILFIPLSLYLQKP